MSAHRSLALTVELVIDVDDLGDHVGVVLGQVAQLAEVAGGLLVSADLDEPSRGVGCEEAEDEDDGCKVEVEGVWHDPLSRRVVGDVQRASIRCKVATILISLCVPSCETCDQNLQHNAEVNTAREHADTQTSDGARSDLSKVGGSNYNRLPYANPGAKPASIDHSDAAVGTGAQEDGDSSYPYQAQFSCCPETTNTVSDEESDQGAEDGTKLYHRRDVGQKVGLFGLGEAFVLQAELGDERCL